MNYFFGLVMNIFIKSYHTKFQNRSLPKTEIELWSITSNGKLWEITCEKSRGFGIFSFGDSSIDNKRFCFGFTK